MTLWRVSNHITLNGEGGLYVSGRWHTKGHLVFYCSLNPATALLETLVHIEIDTEDRPDHFRLLRIEPDNLTEDRLSVERINPHNLPDGWVEDVQVTQEIGDQWLAENRSLLLEVPCVLVPATWNVLVNPRHPDAKHLELAEVIEHPFDPRLWS
jgi:RES domain-containing protein